MVFGTKSLVALDNLKQVIRNEEIPTAVEPSSTLHCVAPIREFPQPKLLTATDRKMNCYSNLVNSILIWRSTCHSDDNRNLCVKNLEQPLIWNSEQSTVNKKNDFGYKSRDIPRDASKNDSDQHVAKKRSIKPSFPPSPLSSIFFLHTPAAICMRGYFPVGKGLDGKRSLLLSLRIRHPHPLCTDFDLFLSRLRR
ncbi:hypothetical protein CDAR_475981 [Caerostris darwini]|uniref:Uncharacterized protein n=1 Tax=Caerostris darwini TaxID=1538125 RepID=A0AAV4PAE2_9ARAC|nr:hypothetical protein CDAR_475981 [Caerostris darwini]